MSENGSRALAKPSKHYQTRPRRPAGYTPLHTRPGHESITSETVPNRAVGHNRRRVLDVVGQTVAYVRVSSAEQNLDRQLEAVGECDRIFEDKISGSSRAKRTGLAELMTYVRAGGTW